MANILYSIENKLPKIKAKVYSRPLSITTRVANELAFWKNKKETSSGAYERLKRYWDNTPLRDWKASETPWSAAFISYILKDENFKGQASHYQYTQDVIDGKNRGWEAFSIPKNKKNLKIQVGDVFVKPRSGGDYSTHGDVVASISMGKATLVGGNLGNTAKKAGTIKLNTDGTINDAGSYIILLKKNPIEKVNYGWSRILAFGGFAVAGILTATLGWMVVSRKKNERLLIDNQNPSTQNQD